MERLQVPYQGHIHPLVERHKNKMIIPGLDRTGQKTTKDLVEERVLKKEKDKPAGNSVCLSDSGEGEKLEQIPLKQPCA
jgi:hypothetical protein